MKREELEDLKLPIVCSFRDQVVPNDVFKEKLVLKIPDVTHRVEIRSRNDGYTARLIGGADLFNGTTLVKLTERVEQLYKQKLGEWAGRTTEATQADTARQ